MVRSYKQGTVFARVTALLSGGVKEEIVIFRTTTDD
jgi:hypothetical protein